MRQLFGWWAAVDSNHVPPRYDRMLGVLTNGRL